MRKRDLGTRLRAWLPVILWMGLIFYLSSQPDIPYHPNVVADHAIKKAAHMAEYGVLALLLRRAVASTTQTHSPDRWAFLLALLYALSDEVHQLFVPGRNGTLFDVGFDAMGAVLALLLLRWRRGRVTLAFDGDDQPQDQVGEQARQAAGQKQP